MRGVFHLQVRPTRRHQECRWPHRAWDQHLSAEISSGSAQGSSAGFRLPHATRVLHYWLSQLEGGGPSLDRVLHGASRYIFTYLHFAHIFFLTHPDMVLAHYPEGKLNTYYTGPINFFQIQYFKCLELPGQLLWVLACPMTPCWKDDTTYFYRGKQLSMASFYSIFI